MVVVHTVGEGVVYISSGRVVYMGGYIQQVKGGAVYRGSGWPLPCSPATGMKPVHEEAGEEERVGGLEVEAGATGWMEKGGKEAEGGAGLMGGGEGDKGGGASCALWTAGGIPGARAAGRGRTGAGLAGVLGRKRGARGSSGPEGRVGGTEGRGGGAGEGCAGRGREVRGGAGSVVVRGPGGA